LQKRPRHERTVHLHYAFRGPRSHDFAMMGLAFIYPALPTCLVVYVQKLDFLLINMFCVVIAIKNVDYLCLAQVVFSHFLLHSSRYLWCSYTFAQPGVQTARWS